MVSEQKPIGVLGAGPVGSILAATFLESGRPVLLVECADDRRAQIAEHGLKVEGRAALFTRNVKVLGSIAALKGEGLEALFICTKTWALRSLLPELSQALGPEALVISFQNGIGPEDEVAQFFAPSRVARGIVNYAGGVAPGSGIVSMQWFNPPNLLGPLDEAATPRLRALAADLSRAGLETQSIPIQETKKLIFFKTILNSALNALCAASGITMRQAMTYPHTRNLARLLIREGLSVAAAVGYTYGEDAQEVCMRYLDQGGDHLPSMYTDLKRGSRTEIEYINGKIVKIGMMFKNVDVDANIFFTAAIVTQEIRSGVRRPDEIPEYLTHF